MVHREIRSLTGVRGVAACVVMLYHLDAAQMEAPLIRNGYLAVDLFFVLSGFVMTLTYAHGFEQTSVLPAYRQFLLRRIARIYPLYLLLTLVMGIFVVTGVAEPPVPFPPFVVMANGVMMQAWLLGQSLNGVTWSISTECAAYLAFPVLLMLPMRARPGIQAAAGALCVAALVLIACLPTDMMFAGATVGLRRHGPIDADDGGTPWPLLRCLAEFTLGMLAWRAWQTAGFQRVATGWLTTSWLLLTIAIWCARGADVALVIAFVGLVALLAADRGLAARWLGSKIPYALGQWSYAIYLIHPAVIVLLLPFARALARLHIPHAWSLSVLLAIPVILILSWWTHHAFERPARHWVREALAGKAKKGVLF